VYTEVSKGDEMSDKTDELRAKIDTYSDELMRRLEAGPSEHYLHYLTFMSRFHKYSSNNQILIWMQNPDATHVAGFQKWLQMKNPVRKGEKSMKILAPLRKKEIDPNTGDTVWRMRGFTVASVFDVSQTQDPTCVPQFFQSLGDDKQALYDAVLRAMRAEGIIVEEHDAKSGGAEGWSGGGKVGIFSGAPVNNKATVAIHEWAHERNHWGNDRSTFSTERKELHAESIAFIVAAHFGVDITHSSDYLHNWGANAESFKKEMDIIAKSAKEMITAIEEKT
jgi:hypothetical protein